MKDKDYHRQYNLKRRDKKRLNEKSRYYSKVGGTRRDRFLLEHDWDIEKNLLSDRERILLSLYYSLDEFSNLPMQTLEKIAKRIGVSRQYCGILHKEAILKLQSVKNPQKTT